MKKKIVCIVGIILLVLMTWFGYLSLRHPYLGINLHLNDRQEWEVLSLDPTAAPRMFDIQKGDIIVRIDEKAPEEHFSVVKWSAIEQSDVVEIIRNQGEPILVSTSKFYFSLSHDILPTLAVLICLLSALLLLVKVKSRSSVYLSLVFVTIAVTYMSLGASVRGDTLGKILMANCMALIPVIFLHFLVVFFKEKGNVQLKSNYLMYVYIYLIFHSLVVAYVFIQPNGNYQLYRFITFLSMFIFLAGIIFNIVLLVKLYITHRRERSYLATIIRFVLVSLTLSFSPVILLSFLSNMLIGRELLPSFSTSWCVLLFPLAFAYLIVTKKLYDVDVVLRRIFFTAIMALAPSAGILFAVILFSLDPVELRKNFFLFLAIMIIMTFVLYSIEHMYTRLERFMFPRKHLLQAALKRISRDLTSTTSFRDLKDLILLDIVETLQVYGGAIVFKYRDSTEIIQEGEIEQDAIELLMGQDPPDEHPELMCFEINRHEQYTSYLIITRKKSNTRLGLEEVQWLNLIISYLAVSLENIYLIRKLTDKLNRLASQLPDEQEAQDFNWFRKLTFELQERERVRIATDLHDTTMQDLFFLKRKLAALGEKHHLSPEIRNSIAGLLEYVEIINVNLRQSCFDLHPYLLQEIGLIRTVEKVVERESYVSPFQIHFDAVGSSAIERKDLETKRHLFRIVQELLNNAKKHSNATRVHIRLTTSNGKFLLHYRDDGVGFDPRKLPTPDIGTSGVGMEQLRSRVLHLQGHLQLDAVPGAGVDIRITFPIKEEISA